MKRVIRKMIKATTMTRGQDRKRIKARVSIAMRTIMKTRIVMEMKMAKRTTKRERRIRATKSKRRRS
jgi:hypothetical protein